MGKCRNQEAHRPKNLHQTTFYEMDEVLPLSNRRIDEQDIQTPGAWRMVLHGMHTKNFMEELLNDQLFQQPARIVLSCSSLVRIVGFAFLVCLKLLPSFVFTCKSSVHCLVCHVKYRVCSL